MRLYLDVAPGESVRIGADTVVTVEEKSGRRTRLRVESPHDVDHRKGGARPLSPPPAKPAPAAPAPEPQGAPIFRRNPIPAA